MNLFDRPTPQVVEAVPLETIHDNSTIQALLVFTPEFLIEEAHRVMAEAGFDTFREAMETVRIGYGLSPDGDLFPVILESSS